MATNPFAYLFYLFLKRKTSEQALTNCSVFSPFRARPEIAYAGQVPAPVLGIIKASVSLFEHLHGIDVTVGKSGPDAHRHADLSIGGIEDMIFKFAAETVDVLLGDIAVDRQ